MSGDINAVASSDLTINPQNTSGNLTYIAVWKAIEVDNSVVDQRIQAGRDILYGLTPEHVTKVKEVCVARSADIR